MTQSIGSTPSISEFDPRKIPMQWQVIKDVRWNFDYDLGFHTILLSGAVGSSKSLLMAHLAVTHCLLNKNAHFGLGRLTMPDLKATLLQTIIDHLSGEENLIEGKHWKHNEQKGSIVFSTGSKITSISWADKKFKKPRSQAYTAFAIEEITESDENYKEFYPEIRQRLGRLSHVKEKFLIAACNPDSPGHWVYKEFIEKKSPTHHVYYSKTADNPFLPETYLKQLEESLDPKMARRMLYGEWIEIAKDIIYHQYSAEHNYRDAEYVVNPFVPIRISHDFNIGEGKPMSAVLSQYYNDEFHFFDEVVIEGARTLDIYEELALRGYFEKQNAFFIHGDASGKHKDTRSITSDYDLIRKFLSNYRKKDGSPIQFVIDVPLANPPIRARHNRVNAYCLNLEGRRRLFVYKKAKTLHQGLRLTELKKGGQYVEDDSKPFQHITTAAGYGIMSTTKEKSELIEFNRWRF